MPAAGLNAGGASHLDKAIERTAEMRSRYAVPVNEQVDLNVVAAEVTAKSPQFARAEKPRTHFTAEYSSANEPANSAASGASQRQYTAEEKKEKSAAKSHHRSSHKSTAAYRRGEQPREYFRMRMAREQYGAYPMGYGAYGYGWGAWPYRSNCGCYGGWW